MADRFALQLNDHAVRRPGVSALLSDSRELSYLALRDAVKVMCAQLDEGGVSARSVVGVSIDDEIVHMIVSLAALATGCAQVVLPTYDNTEIRSELARRAGVTQVVCNDDRMRLEGIGSLLLKSPVYDGMREEPLAATESPGYLYLQTAGTTGRPNLVPLSEEQLGLQASRHSEYRDERLLRLASVEYNNSKRHRLYCLWNGGTNIFRPRGELSVPGYCAEQRVTCLDISRMHAAELIRSGMGQMPATVKIRTGGSSIPIDMRRDLESSVTRNLYVRYATTECGAIAMAGPGEHDDDEPVGKPIAGVELQIVENDVPLPFGTSGNIRLRAPGIATGYLEASPSTARRFRDGWFYPGDVGTLREDGQLLVHGRADDMINLNGINIFPMEIERALERHPAVKVAAAVPLESAAHGQIPVVAVELRDGAEVSATELQRYSRETLGLHAPRRVMILERGLPRTPQGKIIKRSIAALFLRRKAKP